MRRAILALALAGTFVLGTSVGVAATATEDAARASLTDCLISAEAQKLGTWKTVPQTNARCFAYLASIGKTAP